LIINKPISVTWTLNQNSTGSANAPGGNNDWVGLFKEESNNRSYLYYEWTASHKGSSAKFVAPNFPGNYVFRYFGNRSYTLLGSSKPFVVGPTYRLLPTVGQNNQVKINIKQTFGKSYPRSWLGLYEPSKPNNSYLTFENVGEKQEVSFTVPKAGVWEFRLFPQRAYDQVAACKVDVNGDTKLELSVDGDNIVLSYNVTTLDTKVDRVWFGIYHVSEKNYRYYQRFQYIWEPIGTKKLKMIKKNGTYEARLFAHGTTTVICTSNAITV